MRGFNSVFSVMGVFVFLLGTTRVGVSVPPPDNPKVYSGQATISTANCSGAGGLCQPAPACNNGAGPNPDTIQATVTLCEVWPGGGLRVNGSGTGFRFGKTYVSLLYLNGNTATCSRFPPGVPPTLQNLPQADSDFASMHLGFWVVNPDGTATLTTAKEATVTGLNNYQTVSVREMQPPNTVCFNCGLDPAPQLNALRACGALTVATGGLAGDCGVP
jgi:hypothetical protein